MVVDAETKPHPLVEAAVPMTEPPHLTHVHHQQREENPDTIADPPANWIPSTTRTATNERAEERADT